jgi:rhodanese-related sulfurtransferase
MIASSGPAWSAENWPDSLDSYVSGIRKGIPVVDMQGYLDIVRKPDGAILIDVRDADELKSGMVPGAINISRGWLELRIWRATGYPKQIDLARKIYVQCGNGRRATLAAKQLKDIGFTNVTVAIVDMTDWEKKSYPLVKAAPK